MSMNFKGIFSLGLRSTELQLATLFDNVGGLKMVELLDKIGNFSTTEQENLLKFFNEVMDKEMPKMADEPNELASEIDRAILLEKPVAQLKVHKSGKILKLHDFKHRIGA